MNSCSATLALFVMNYKAKLRVNKIRIKFHENLGNATLKIQKYEGVSKSFRTEATTKYTLTFGITRREATEGVMARKTQ
jgi:hypothetical protein